MKPCAVANRLGVLLALIGGPGVVAVIDSRVDDTHRNLSGSEQGSPEDPLIHNPPRNRDT
jgi:hypothetical protein